MKKIIALGLVAAGAAWYFGREKVADYKTILQKLKFDFLGISNLKWKNNKVNFTTNIRLTNTSDIGLSLLTGNAVVVRRMEFYTKGGEYLGEAKPNITGIELPAHGSLEIKNIPATVPITEIEDLFGTAWQVFSNPDSLKVKIEVEALGQTTIIEA